ncbi:MAG TPA: GAF domain-containing protein [Chloroflexia bacterium]|nr:GAF domain-containing protein [Chloroflexia bacterium]
MSSARAISDPKQPEAQAPRAEARVEQLLALNKGAVAITSELDLDSLLQRIVDVAREMVGCNYAALGVLGDDGYIKRFPTSGISETEREKIGAPPRGHGLLGVMLRAGRSLRIPDMSKDPRRSGFPPNHPPMTSLLGVPIFVRGKLMGDLYLTDKIDGPEFNEEDEWLVQLLATHAATALTNAELHAENVQALDLARRERARSSALFKVSQAINRSVRLDEVIQLIVQSAVDLLDAAGAAVYLLERISSGDDEQARAEQGEARHFVARYALGLEQSFTSEPAQLPVDRSVAGRAVQSGKTQVVGDTNQEAEDIVFPQLVGKPVRSLVAVPLMVGGEMLGVLSTYADRPDGFDQGAVQLVEAFGAVASTAIYNASLYEEAQRGREAAEREQQRLRELEQMKDEFLSTAAHELRTPLTTIVMSAGLAREQLELLAVQEQIDSRIADLVGLIVEGSKRMHSLVNDLLDLTRLEQGKATFTVEDLDLREVVTASVESVAPLFESKHQKLDVRLPETYCGVRGDRQRLEQVVINLLSNANKYSPPNTQVEIKAIRSGDECQIAVRDNGPGVPEEERERIFDRFYRSSLHRTDRTPSTGLGLPIARKVAEMHKGRVRVDAAPGGGSIFTLTLPAAS